MTQNSMFEMFWDCDACGTKKLLGVSHRNCPSCGKAQNASSRYFPAEGEAIALNDHIYTGADWICNACNHPNNTRAKFCTSCGCGSDGTKTAKLIEDKAKINIPDLNILGDMVPKAKPLSKIAQLKRKAKKYAIIAGVIAVIVFLFYPRSGEGYVKGHKWERIVKIEQQVRKTNTIECSQVNASMKIVQSRIIEKTRSVQNGESCQEVCDNANVDQGDGSFRVERKCRQECSPRYVDQNYLVKVCDVEFFEWRVTREIRNEGQSPSEPMEWPKLQLGNSQGLSQLFAKGLGHEREGPRIAVNTLIVERNGKTNLCVMEDFNKWKKYKIGEKIKLTSNGIGGKYCPR